MQNEDLYRQSMQIIKQLYGPDADFRDGQYEAIEATMTNKRTLVVQRTGWGKSLVYFVCTRLLRSRGHGVTLVVSPLLVLMKNQIEAANKLGLRCDVLNSESKGRRDEILSDVENGALDLILITPESLFSEDVQSRLPNIRIGLFVIDEAHCISDWGHDFRLEYGRLRNVIVSLPSNVPLLATTATANNRVLDDLKRQMGEDVYVSRGTLARDSLHIQVLNLPDPAQRYAWILQNLPNLDGSGIIYCLTQRSCDYLADFLNKNGIAAEAYYSRSTEEGNSLNNSIEERFRKNEIKVIVATIKLGMGYDKGDISFVIHFQMPSNIVSYYQQIGRAGRNIPEAYVFLMFGKEDLDINNHFINTAFPKKEESDAVIELLKNTNGLSKRQIEARVNIRRNRIEKALAFLQNEGYIRRDGAKFYIAPKPYEYNGEIYESVSAVRRDELMQMLNIGNVTECYGKYIVNCLDDFTAVSCGKCSNCLGHDIIPSSVTLENKNKAAEYINGRIIDIEPRKQWPEMGNIKAKMIAVPNQVGICLSKYGDAGYGELVSRDKYSGKGCFCEELLGHSLSVLRPKLKLWNIGAVVWVPSLRSNIVKDFALRLADMLDLPAIEALRKTDARHQKYMENSSYQCSNAKMSFELCAGISVPDSVLLVDDVVDSGWTLAVCGDILVQAGCERVYPFALADSSKREV